MSDTTFNNRLNKLFDTMPVMMWMSDSKGYYCNFNERWLQFRGRKLKEEIGQGWTEGIHSDDLSRYTQLYHDALRGNKSFEAELRIKHADGTYRIVLFKGESQFENDTFTGHTGVCVDVTDLPQQQYHVQRAATLTEETNSIAKVGGWEYDLRSGKITWTREVYKIHEVDFGKEISSDYAHSFYHNDDKELMSQYFEDAIIHGKGFNIEMRIISANNNIIWVNIKAKVIINNGIVERIIGTMQDITDQKNVDLSLIESERRLHFVLDGLPVAVYLTDANGYITNYNKSAAELWGKAPLKNKVQWSGAHKLYSASGLLIDNDKSPMATAIKQNKIIHGEEIISECEQGTKTNIIVFATPYNSVKGQLGGALNVLVDITERKQLEEKLTGLSLVARKTSNAVIISDEEGRIKWVNQSFTSMSGYTLEEVLGKRPSEILHCEETNKRTTEAVYEALSKEQPIRFEILNKGKHGNKYWLDVDVQPLRDDHGNLTGFISVETDITELKYIHEQLKKSENKLRAILDSTSDDNILVDPDYKIISVNKVANEHLKSAYGSEPVIGQLIWDYVQEDLRPEFEQTFNQAIAGFMSKKEREMVVRGDVKMWFEFCFYPVYAIDGSVIGVAINSKNIHAKKTAELKVHHQNAMLKEIAFAQSHTLRRPVANIMGLWNLIINDCTITEDNPELVELMEYLDRSVKEVDTVIRNIINNTYNIKV